MKLYFVSAQAAVIVCKQVGICQPDDNHGCVCVCVGACVYLCMYAFASRSADVLLVTAGYLVSSERAMVSSSLSLWSVCAQWPPHTGSVRGLFACFKPTHIHMGTNI